MTNVLRDYQERAVNSGLNDLCSGEPGIQLAMCTGSGKTRTCSALLSLLVREEPRPLIGWVTHRDELKDQTRTHLEADGLRVVVDMGAERADATAVAAADVVIMSPASMIKRLENYPRNAFRYLVFDENHRAAAKTWKAIAEYHDRAQLIGLSATPVRSDGQKLEKWFPKLSFSFSVAEAMAACCLCPVQVQEVFVSSFTPNQTAEDFTSPAIAEALMRNGAIYAAMEVVVRSIGDRPGIVFVPSVEAADLAAQYACDNLVNAAAVSGSTPKKQRQAILDEYRAGNIQLLVNAMLFIEGTDLPRTAYLGILRPTTNPVLLQQMFGRALRLHAGKADALIQSFQPGALTRKPSFAPADLFRGAEFRKLEDIGANPWKRAEEEAQAKRAADEADAMAEGRRIRAVGVEREIVNIPLERLFRGLLGTWFHVGEPLKEWQREFLERNKVSLKQVTTREQADIVYQAAKLRRQQGLCTLPQAKKLAAKGLNPNVSFDEAQFALGRIEMNGWARPAPESLRRDPRFAPDTNDPAQLVRSATP